MKKCNVTSTSCKTTGILLEQLSETYGSKSEKKCMDFLRVDQVRQIWHLSFIFNISGLDWSIWFNVVERSINEAAEIETGSTQISGTNRQWCLAKGYAEIRIMRLQAIIAAAPPGSVLGQILQNTNKRHPRTVQMRFTYKEAQ